MFVDIFEALGEIRGVLIWIHYDRHSKLLVMMSHGRENRITISDNNIWELFLYVRISCAPTVDLKQHRRGNPPHCATKHIELVLLGLTVSLDFLSHCIVD